MLMSVLCLFVLMSVVCVSNVDECCLCLMSVEVKL